jgi:hypothetical protein
MFIFIIEPFTYLFYFIFIVFQESYNILIQPSINYLCSNINLVNISYNLLYFVSLCQIKINKILKYIYIDNSKIDNNNNIIIECYKEGKQENKLNVNNIFDIDIDTIHTNNYDYMIITEHTNKNKIFTTKLTNNIQHEESNIKFVALNVNYNDNNFKINLKDNNHNYYVVNNEINKQFIEYYLENVLNVPIDKNNFKYDIELIDHDVNFLNLSHEDNIIIEKDHYIIKRNNTN